MAIKRRSVPARMCIVCGQKTDKRDLIRVVAKPDGGAIVDMTGKSQGRGAYLCGSDISVPHEVKRGRLEYALRTNIDDKEWIDIQNSLREFRVSH